MGHSNGGVRGTCYSSACGRNNNEVLIQQNLYMDYYQLLNKDGGHSLKYHFKVK